ncbi:L-threonylcarbamoyladenylate synthase [Feifania hominis]|uniref:Threonylcarbamoyl-AMP synthase n=1 Tax=Feifania hominis TaxID=2763660 RepID=A0A926DET7_9FIRM|nr:L-threonylcarbamoyladenylate synthase [Feifania hominis]MBC8536527.1 threonylcarbamoyl-AMP synthase [Feifania hominis]
MQTTILTINRDHPDERAVETAGRALREGKLVIFPTETVYGLGASAYDAAAAAAIYRAKGRPSDNPLIVHIADIADLPLVAREVPPEAMRLFEACSPGPLTVVLKKSDRIPDAVSAGLDTVAVRIPSHPTARAIIRAAGVPIAAPSANLSGKPSPTRAGHIIREMDGRVDYIVAGEDCDVGVESTVVTLAVAPPRLLRPGGVTLAQLEEILGPVETDQAVMHAISAGAVISSPGMKYRHYAPASPVAIVEGSGAMEYIRAHLTPDIGVLCFDGEQELFAGAKRAIPYGDPARPETLAHNLFDALRAVDEDRYELVYARAPEPQGVGLAVYNRLLKAAGHTVIDAPEVTE